MFEARRARLGHLTSTSSKVASVLVPALTLQLVVVGCMGSRDCYRLGREMPVIELVDRLGDPGVPYYDTTLSFASGYRDYPRCPAFDSMVPGTHISTTNVYVGRDSFVCQMMTADAQFETGTISFDLPLADSSLEDSVYSDLNDLATQEVHLLLGSAEARFGGCSGYWLTVVSGGTDRDGAAYGDPYSDPGEGSLPPWYVYRLFRPSDDPGCAELEPCVDGFTARMVMR